MDWLCRTLRQLVDRLQIRASGVSLLLDGKSHYTFLFLITFKESINLLHSLLLAFVEKVA